MTAIIDKEVLYSMAEELDTGLKNVPPPDDPISLLNYATTLEGWLATTSFMIASAQYHFDKRKNQVISMVVDNKSLSELPATVIKEKILGECSYENMILNWIEQINKNIKYNLDMTRTLISYQKTDMQNLNSRI